MERPPLNSFVGTNTRPALNSFSQPTNTRDNTQERGFLGDIAVSSGIPRLAANLVRA